MNRERTVQPVSGLLVLVFVLAGFVASGASLVTAIHDESGGLALVGIALLVLTVLGMAGLFIVNPNEARVLQLFGRYVGSAREQGLRWANPFFTKRKISVRVRNFESGVLKVNDSDGNPIEIAAVVVWKVVDTAEALFEVDDFEHYVHVQSEAALRNLATSYPYDAHEEGQVALRSHAGEISERLQVEIQERLKDAGVEVLEARISHLAYAAEIASAMLQRQQATAVVAAREKIVEGAVGMVEMALEQLDEKERVHLNDERRADIVANLLVVLCSDRGAQPVISAQSSAERKPGSHGSWSG